jgi:hypothetical protein
VDSPLTGSKTSTSQRLLDTFLDVAIMAVIVGSFLWGGYAFKIEPLVVRPAQSSPRF